jgi:hypothetical protein
MLKTISIILPQGISREEMTDALIGSGIREQGSFWIFSAAPSRHVRFHLTPVTNLEIEPEQLKSIQLKLNGINDTGFWIEMSSDESEGRLAAKLSVEVIRQLESGLVIDENDQLYELSDLETLVKNDKGFYEFE